MKLYLRAHAWLPLVAAATLIAGLMAGVVDVHFKLPPAGTFDVPVGVLGGILPALLVAYTIAPLDLLKKALSSRRLLILDLILLLSATLLPAICYLAVRWNLASDTDIVAARNYLGLLGLGLSSAATLGYATLRLIPTAMLMISVTAGVADSNQPWPWAWPIHQAGSPGAAIVAMALFALGLALVCWRNAIRRRRLFSGSEPARGR